MDHACAGRYVARAARKASRTACPASTGSPHRVGPGLHRHRPLVGARGRAQRHAARDAGAGAGEWGRCRARGEYARLARANAALSSAEGGADGKDLAPGLSRIVIPTALALMLCNMDRICMSVAILPLSTAMGWAPSVQGVVQSAFLWGYTATQLIGGALADRFGGKAVLAAGVAWFSAASLLLPAALSAPVAAAGLSLPAVLAARAAVGLGEGVVLPSMNALVARLVAPSRRATALGACFGGFHSGNLVGLVLSPLILQTLGWQWLFLIFGLLGAPLLLMWQKVVPEVPRAEAPGGGAGAAQPSLAQLLRSPAVWAIAAANTVNHWGYFFYLNWMPTYFTRALGLDMGASSFASFVAWLAMAVGSSLSGVIADGMVRRGTPTLAVRRILQSLSFLAPAATLTVIAAAGTSLTPFAATALLTAVLSLKSLGQAGFVANMSDIAPTAAGKVFGVCNTLGCLSGTASAVVTGVVVEKTGSFSPIFQATAALYLVGTLVFCLFSSADREF
ncbi:unnamed protein product [Pedinophyceae sp. YPF-701]|nr:unnamed protein product [Pedinophyceae sp. YPF-701]